MSATPFMKYFVSVVLVFFVVQHCAGQGYIIKGTITDTLNIAPLYRSSVVLLRAKDSIIETFTRAKPNGSFELQVPVPGKYIIQVSFPVSRIL